MERGRAPWLDPPLWRAESRRGNRRVRGSRDRRLFASRARVRCVADAAATRPGRCRGPEGSRGAPRPYPSDGETSVSGAPTDARREPSQPERFGARALPGSPRVERCHRARRGAALRRRPAERRQQRRV